MNLLYQLGLTSYVFLAQFVAFFQKKARLWVRGQRNVYRELQRKVDPTFRIVWIHCASLGEFEQGRPLIEKIRTDYPRFKILLTFFSPSGYEIRKDYSGADFVSYLPLDTRRNAVAFIRMIQPEMVFFVKYEFWPNYFRELHRQHIPLYLVSAVFRPQQLFFKKGVAGNWYRKALKNGTHFFVQNQQSVDLLKGIGVNSVTRTGDTRFDRVAEIAANRKNLPLIRAFKGNCPLIVAGSSWEPDEEILADYIRSSSNVKIIFAPHEIKPANLKRLMSIDPDHSAVYSELKEESLSGLRILVIDSIGLLSSVYQYGDVAYIGGGFGVGIHNTLEAAIYAIPVLFGPNYLKFDEAVQLVTRELGFPVANAEELRRQLDQLLMNGQLRKKIAGGCRAFMTENIGATEMILTSVFENYSPASVL